MEVVYKMNWNKGTVLKFLELYQMNPCLWDPEHEFHKNRYKVNEAWLQIQKKLAMPCSISELKKKKESLMSAYRSYRTKIKRHEHVGRVYEPTWFAFDIMDSFLGSVYTCNASIDPGAEESMEYISVESDGEISEQSDCTSVVIKEEFPQPRRKRPNEFGQVREDLDDGNNFLNPGPQQTTDDDDECATFGLLIAKKLRKLSDERKDVMMVRINQLFVDEHKERNSSRRNIPTSSKAYPTSSESASQEVSSPGNYDPLLEDVKPNKSKAS